MSSKKKEMEDNDEKDLALSKTLNLQLTMGGNDLLPKGWNLVNSLHTQDSNKSSSLKKHPKWIELLGDHYAFYTNAPSLKNFPSTTFLFSVKLRSTSPGVRIQYYDGIRDVTSAPYASKKGEWETLNIKFTVNANAKLHRLYAAILGSVKNDNPSVDINAIQLERTQMIEEIERKGAPLNSRKKCNNLSFEKKEKGCCNEKVSTLKPKRKA